MPVRTVCSSLLSALFLASVGPAQTRVAFFQPTSLGVRDDVDPAECVIGQLKYKAGDKDEDEG